MVGHMRFLGSSITGCVAVALCNAPARAAAAQADISVTHDWMLDGWTDEWSAKRMD